MYPLTTSDMWTGFKVTSTAKNDCHIRGRVLWSHQAIRNRGGELILTYTSPILPNNLTTSFGTRIVYLDKATSANGFNISKYTTRVSRLADNPASTRSWLVRGVIKMCTYDMFYLVCLSCPSTTLPLAYHCAKSDVPRSRFSTRMKNTASPGYASTCEPMI